VLFSLIASTGLCTSEALRIQRTGLDWTDFSIKILGKGSRERIISFGIERLKLLLRELRPQKVMKPFLTENCSSRCKARWHRWPHLAHIALTGLEGDSRGSDPGSSNPHPAVNSNALRFSLFLGGSRFDRNRESLGAPAGKGPPE
jgi:integrase